MIRAFDWKEQKLLLTNYQLSPAERSKTSAVCIYQKHFRGKMFKHLPLMLKHKQVFDEKQQLTPHFRVVARCWDVFKEFKKEYGDRLNKEFFVKRHPNHVQLFYPRHDEDQRAITHGIAEQLIEEYSVAKHGVAVSNFLESVMEFVGGNEDSKPIMYALGRVHKENGVTEKMFVEMKVAIVEILKQYFTKEQAVSWELTLEYMYINYIFRGMNM